MGDGKEGPRLGRARVGEKEDPCVRHGELGWVRAGNRIRSGEEAAGEEDVRREQGAQTLGRAAQWSVLGKSRGQGKGSRHGENHGWLGELGESGGRREERLDKQPWEQGKSTAASSWERSRE